MRNNTGQVSLKFSDVPYSYSSPYPRMICLDLSCLHRGMKLWFSTGESHAISDLRRTGLGLLDKVSRATGSLTETYAKLWYYRAIQDTKKERLYMHRGLDIFTPTVSRVLLNINKGVQWSIPFSLPPVPTCLSPDSTSECRVPFYPSNEVLTEIAASYLICLTI
jgi:hypothetical protein